MAGMGDALQEALQSAMADKLDSEIMQGTNGLLTGTILANHAQGSGQRLQRLRRGPALWESGRNGMLTTCPTFG